MGIEAQGSYQCRHSTSQKKTEAKTYVFGFSGKCSFQYTPRPVSQMSEPRLYNSAWTITLTLQRKQIYKS